MSATILKLPVSTDVKKCACSNYQKISFELFGKYLTKISTNKTKEWNQNFVLMQGKLRKNQTFPNQSKKSTSNSKATSQRHFNVKLVEESESISFLVSEGSVSHVKKKAQIS